jgi:2-alkenal reductase
MNDYYTYNRSRRGRSYFWVVVVLIAFSLFGGTAFGGAVGFILASNLEGLAQTEVQPVNNTVLPEPANAANIAPPPVERQPLVVTEESASVEAVRKTMAAVVTVISQNGRTGGSGSGFFISDAGYVVTNNHVIAEAQELAVVYAQGGTAPAELVGTAPEFDLAVLKVDGPVPAFVEWGDSGELPLGANVIAIGSALGRYQNSVTAGILSGFNRELGELRGLLQTDAAINHGNSGGPLINLAGQVVGINTMVVRGGFTQAEGLGFAIPSNVAQTVVGRLIERGEVRPSFLGIQYQELNPQLAMEENLSISQGALLQDVIIGTPASRAGLQVGDIILSIDGKPVDDRHPLVSLLLEHVAGETITVEVLREGETIRTTLTLGERA